MRDLKKIQVLWVENDSSIISDIIEEALDVAEIELYPFSCWEDAEEALEADYTRWDAILLDAKCSFKRGDADKATRFLTNVFRRIDKLATIKKRSIPWYVLSGGGEDEIKDLIPVEIEWDADWLKISNRRFYSKSGTVMIGDKEILERHALFSRIRNQVIYNNPQLSIEYNEYPEVFHALDGLDLASEVGLHLMYLLEPIHFHSTSSVDYNNRYMNLRKALEHIFRHMFKNGILPDKIFKETNAKDEIILRWCSKFLGEEKKLDDKFWSDVSRNTPDGRPLLPKQLADWLKSAVFQSGGAAHTSPAEAEIKMNLDNYLPQVCGSPYMLRSLAMGLCDFILWYDNFLKEHPDAEKNAVDFWTRTGDKF